MPLGGWISDCVTRSSGAKSGRRVVPMVGMSLGAVLLYAGTIVPGTAAAVISLSLAIGFASWCEGPFWACAIEVSDKQVGAACGILNTGGNVGGFLAPIITPYIASRRMVMGLVFGQPDGDPRCDCVLFCRSNQPEERACSDRVLTNLSLMTRRISSHILPCCFSRRTLVWRAH